MSFQKKLKFERFSESLGEPEFDSDEDDGDVKTVGTTSTVSATSTFLEAEFPPISSHSVPAHYSSNIIDHNTKFKFGKFNNMVMVIVALIVIFLVFVGFVVLIAFIVKCDEQKIMKHMDDRKTSSETAISQYTEMWQKSELSREKDYKSGKIRWISYDKFDRKNLENVEPGGMERLQNNNLLLYVGRAAHRNGTVIGKYCPYLNQFYFGYLGKESTKSDFEILQYPIGSLSWLPTTVEKLPPEESLVFGGYARMSEDATYICRIKLDGHIIIGKIFLDDKTGCYAAYKAKEFAKSEFEILAINEMGLMMGVSA